MPAFKAHAMQPSTLLDEQARQDFVGALRAHLSGRLMPGAYTVYESRVEPAFRARHGRAPLDQDEIRKFMTQDSFYQFWSAMQRRSQELLWESVIDPTERELPELLERSKKIAASGKIAGAKLKARNGRRRGSLRLNPALEIPRYHRAADILEQAIDAIRCCSLHIFEQVAALVVDAGIEAELVDHIAAFLFATRETNDTAAFELGELTHHAADRATRRCHSNGLACGGLNDLVQPVPGRHAGHADHTEIG